MRQIYLVLGALVLSLWVSAALATTLTLKDGTVLHGHMTRDDGGYTMTMADGTTRSVSDDDVASIGADAEDTPQSPPVDSGSAGDSSSGATGSGTATPPDTSEGYNIARERANGSMTAAAAVAIWQQYIDRNSNAADLPSAKDEMARWQKLADDGAEKINGQWVGGPEHQKIVKQSDALLQEALELLEKDETLQAITKLHEAVRIYPNSFFANFVLGDLAMDSRNYDDAMEYYHTAIRLKPNSAATINNLAVANFLRSRYEAGIEGFQQAVEIQDSKIAVQNLVTALALAPPDIRNMPAMKDAISSANLLSSKYGIDGSKGEFFLMPPPSAAEAPSDSSDIPTSGWEGTGFLVSADGLILTNRHVAKGASVLLVRMGKTQMSAEVVAIDDQYDLALIRVKSPTPLPFLHLSADDSPHDGADVTVLGYPLVGELSTHIKITRGIVSSSSENEGNGADVLMDAKVNPGNSGGPILDHFGNVMAIVCMKTLTSGTQDSYGIGISAGHIREFLSRNNVNLDAGTAGAELDTEALAKNAAPATVLIFGTP